MKLGILQTLEILERQGATLAASVLVGPCSENAVNVRSGNA
jgi:hypothetical protein